MNLLKGLSIGFMVAAFLSGCGANEATNQSAEKTTDKTEATTSVDQELDQLIAKFQPLGEIPVPADNPMSEEKIELGKKLYFDSRLSGDNKQSCMSCHAPGAGFGDNRATFTGFQGTQGTRNSPTVINAGYYTANFWDGRAASLEEQALGPIQSEKEMHQNMDELIAELNAVPAYVDEFGQVFDDKITKENIAKAIAAFERTIVVNNSKFDQFIAGDKNALNSQEIEGMKLYAGKANCLSCHAGPTLSNNSYHNLGIEGDDGRFAVTNDEADKGKFRTPGLRGIGHTGPYMHDGSLATIKDVVEFYNKGGGTHPNKDALVKPLNLTDEEVANLVAFLESMSGEAPKVDTPKLP